MTVLTCLISIWLNGTGKTLKIDIIGHGKSLKNAYEKVMESQGEPLSLFRMQYAPWLRPLQAVWLPAITNASGPGTSPVIVGRWIACPQYWGIWNVQCYEAAVSEHRSAYRVHCKLLECKCESSLAHVKVSVEQAVKCSYTLFFWPNAIFRFYAS